MSMDTARRETKVLCPKKLGARCSQAENKHGMDGQHAKIL